MLGFKKEENMMTRKQQVQYLLTRLHPTEISKVIDFMSKLLAENQTSSKVPDLSYSSQDISERIIKEFDKLREKCKKYPIEDLETARRAVLSKKYPQYFE